MSLNTQDNRILCLRDAPQAHPPAAAPNSESPSTPTTDSSNQEFPGTVLDPAWESHPKNEIIPNPHETRMDHSYAVGPIELPVTTIEQVLHDQGKPYGIVPGPDRGYPPFGYSTADCMPITCGGKKRCIGTDKIGHFFQQGYMGFELHQAGISDNYIHAFYNWTEGLPLPFHDPKIHGWLENDQFWFYGFSLRSLSTFEAEWGHVQHSLADVEANLAGYSFYKNVASLCECILWDSLGNKGPRNPSVKCFDICDYITDKWEE